MTVTTPTHPRSLCTCPCIHCSNGAHWMCHNCSTDGEEHVVATLNRHELIVKPVGETWFWTTATVGGRPNFVETNDECRPDPGGDARWIVNDDTALTIEMGNRRFVDQKHFRWLSECVHTFTTSRRLMYHSIEPPNIGHVE